MLVMGDVTQTAPSRRPRGLTEIPLSYALRDSAYLLHCIFGRNVTHRTDFRHRKPIACDDDRLAGLDTVDQFRKPRLSLR